MEKSTQTTTIIAVTLVIMTLIITSSLNPSSNTINANGQAEIEAMPDLITIYFNIETDGSTSKEAEDANSGISNLLIQSLVAQGFKEKEIQTTSYNIYPNYNWNSGTQKIIGYKASHMMKLEISAEDSEKLSGIIDSSTESGALISSIDFALSQEKQNQYKAEALKLASEDARIKAEAVAEGLNKRLGKLVSVSTNDFDYYPWRIYESGSSSEDAKTATANIQPSEQKINARVTAVFKIN